MAICSLLHHYLRSGLVSIYQLQFAAIATQTKNTVSLRTFELQAWGMASDDFRKFGRDALPGRFMIVVLLHPLVTKCCVGML